MGFALIKAFSFPNSMLFVQFDNLLKLLPFLSDKTRPFLLSENTINCPTRKSIRCMCNQEHIAVAEPHSNS